ncbi:LysM peptidoglycan-binding domain-containing protein [Burkholderia pyrrocinia]|nr:LysM peptidoglycan-binding domain-containing protein [Burkholderia pyrrocinia]QVN23835.1 LysM peptidoglycan-binding domain-containing protein [Burkholderia pyrrocinia]
MDKAASSSVARRAIRHHRHVHRDVLADASKSAARPVDSRKGESGDVIAAFAGDASANGRSAPCRRGKADAFSSGVAAGFYRVNSGDTLTRIATAFGQQPKDLRDWNSLTPNSPIQPGQVLRVGPPVEARSRGLAR